MNVDLGIWQKLTRLMALLLFLAAMLAVVFWYIPLIQQNERMRKEIQRLQMQIKAEERATQALEERIRTLRTDPKAVERLARERLGFAKTNETVIFFEPAATNPTVVAPNQ